MRRNNPKFRKKQLGFNAIELGIVILVIAVGVGLAATNGSKLWGTSESGNELQNVSNLYAQTKRLKSVSGYGANGTNLLPQLDAIDSIPNSMAYSGGILTNSWGGTVTLTSTGAGYTLTYNGVPKSSCVELATKISKGGAMSTKPGTGPVVTGEVTAAAATTGCASDTSNTVVFTSLS